MNSRMTRSFNFSKGTPGVQGVIGSPGLRGPPVLSLNFLLVLRIR